MTPPMPLTNRLGQSTSPYLLQHKDNPVHWQTWDEAALAEARRQNKPILLSVGYSACHWCHVMAHESFENEAIAALMNEHFINIKVDREERPDLDAIYQGALHLMGEQGGWPLTMFLTPGAEPYYGGTYFPPEPRYGRAGFPQVLLSLSEAYHSRHEDVLQNVAAIRDALHRASVMEPGAGVTTDHLDRAGAVFLDIVDWSRGGTQGAPKFPQPPIFRFMWRMFKRSGNEKYRDAVLLTLDHMAQGGIWDHAGGGFSRYSTDEVWLAPHFEKMLYDNALLIELYTEAWQETKSDLYATRVTETVGWLFHEMVIDDGTGHTAFAAALDADSEGVEGKFYVWAEDEIDAALDEQDADVRALFKKAYDVTAHGNWEGKIILNRSHHMAAATPKAETGFRLCLDRLLRVREGRIRPGRDDKVICDWNAMMIAALACAGETFDEPDWVEAAENAFDFIMENLGGVDGLRHSWCAGQAGAGGVLDDYAEMVRAALALFEATGQSKYLDAAKAFAKTAKDKFWDDDAGGYFFTAADTHDVIIRTKTVNDNATPSGNGVMAEVLARLHHITGDDVWRTHADSLFVATAPADARAGVNMPNLLSSWMVLADGVSIVIIGDRGTPDGAALMRAAAQASSPGRIVAMYASGTDLPAGHPAHGKGQVGGRATAYVCRAGVCGLPVTEPEGLQAALTAA